MTKKKAVSLPTNAADWDAKTCLRFLARFENLIRKVPTGVRERVYTDCLDSLQSELNKAGGQKGMSLLLPDPATVAAAE